MKPSKLGWFPFVWLMFFLMVPVLLILLTSLQSRGQYGGIVWDFSAANISRLADLLYLKIYFRSLTLSLSTTFICLCLAYPMAWAMATASQLMRSVLMALVAIPFLTNLLIRIYATKLFFGFDGPVIKFLQLVGLEVDPFSLTQNFWLVMYGMITTYLPFMVFPIFGAFDRFNFTLLEAARDLGASSTQIFFRVILPQTKHAAFAGCNLVFIPAMGEFVIPDLLGGARTMLLGNLITEQFLKTRDWPFGSTLSSLLIVLLLAFSFVVGRSAKKRSV